MGAGKQEAENFYDHAGEVVAREVSGPGRAAGIGAPGGEAFDGVNGGPFNDAREAGHVHEGAHVRFEPAGVLGVLKAGDEILAGGFSFSGNPEQALTEAEGEASGRAAGGGQTDFIGWGTGGHGVNRWG